MPRRAPAALLLAALLAPAGASPRPASGAAQALPDPLEAGWQGRQVCERLHETETLRVLRCTFPPDGGHERHFHAPHWGYILEGGRMRITDADGVREVDLRTGADWESDGVEWHEVESIGTTTSRYLIVESR